MPHIGMLPTGESLCNFDVVRGNARRGERTGREKAAQVAITLLADAAELVFAAARVLLRHEPNPGREIPP